MGRLEWLFVENLQLMPEIDVNFNLVSVTKPLTGENFHFFVLKINYLIHRMTTIYNK